MIPRLLQQNEFRQIEWVVASWTPRWLLLHPADFMFGKVQCQTCRRNEIETIDLPIKPIEREMNRDPRQHSRGGETRVMRCCEQKPQQVLQVHGVRRPAGNNNSVGVRCQ